MYYWKLPRMKLYNVYLDMINQPHLLIAGATGSGKSTVTNTIITTLLASAPDRHKLILLDRKGIELDEYRKTPHCLQYAESIPSMISALQWSIEEMQRRYSIMRNTGAKLYHGPDIYLIIDEAADLMTTAARQVTPMLQTLGQLSRAARIHLLLCTQSPLREIIPTRIKCNFPARLALLTATRQDSRNIIDQSGAELLPDPRNGTLKGIYRRNAATTLYTLPRYTDDQRQQVIDHWRRHPRPSWTCRPPHITTDNRTAI